MVSAPVLSLSNFAETFIVQTDASGFAMGVVLLQSAHLIAYFSKIFCPTMSKASTYLRELHAITSAMKHWRQYLLGHFFIIQTDHKSLKELLSQVIQTPEQQYYLSKLLGYHYEIQYKPRRSNMVAYDLSRSQESETAIFPYLSAPKFLFLDEVKKELQADTTFQDLKTRWQQDPTSFPGYTLAENLLIYKGKIWIPSSCRYKKILLKEYHETPIGGHAGLQKP